MTREARKLMEEGVADMRPSSNAFDRTLSKIRRRRVARWLTSMTVIVAVLAGFLAYALIISGGNEAREGQRTRGTTRNAGGEVAGMPGEPGPAIDIQTEGPLVDGERIHFEEAKRRTPYDLPIPPTDERTGDRSGIWIDPGLQVAFVWATDLRFYVDTTELTEEEAIAVWSAKVEEEPQVWMLTSVRGHPAIGTDGQGKDDPSSLTFLERGLMIQFVSPHHTLDELESLAEAIQYEE